jgi:riboflavin kinase / FMN adenylyltransferase
MQVVRPEGSTPPDRGTAVTIGFYDGLHVGHRHVLSVLRDEAHRRGLASAVVTFDRHPATVVRPESAPLLLTDLEQKLELIEESGVDLVLVVAFDEARADESAEDFVSEVLVANLRAREVVVGSDFHFGHGRKGNVPMLRELGSDLGFEVLPVELTSDAGGVTSSTQIRQLVAGGDVAGAARLLGRPHQVRGVTVRGDGRGGTTLGMPTANVAVPPEIAVPGLGIYAGRYERPDGTAHAAAISVGRRPTFYAEGSDHRPVLEAHLLDFEGDLYGEPAKVSFIARLREERRFDSVDDLAAQMRRDVAEVRATVAPGRGSGDRRDERRAV